MVGAMNSLYYLYSGTNYWTMSPLRFSSEFYTAGISLNNAGNISADTIWANIAVRLVINIDPITLTVHGTGTKEDPYTLS